MVSFDSCLYSALASQLRYSINAVVGSAPMSCSGLEEAL